MIRIGTALELVSVQTDIVWISGPHGPIDSNVYIL